MSWAPRLLLTACMLLATAPAAADPAGFGELSKAFRAAHEAADIDALSRLVCWEGVDQRTRESVRRHASDDFGTRIERFEFQPVSDSDVLEYELGGVLYRPNLEPIGWLVVHFAVGPPSGAVQVTNSKYLVGRKADTLRITTAAPASR